MPLTRNDTLVLGALFDNSDIAPSSKRIWAEVPETSRIISEDLTSLRHRETQAIRALNELQPSKSQIQDSVAKLTAIIEEAPWYASAYNNRAQALRLLLGDDLQEEEVADSTLFEDLCSAIELTTPCDPQSPVSPAQANILASAYTQRAKVILESSRNFRKTNEGVLPAMLRGYDAERLEQAAGNDFQMGNKFGNKMAKQMAVHLNPYARMCGKIVREALLVDIAENM